MSGRKSKRVEGPGSQMTKVFRRRECSSMPSAAGGINKVRTED